MGGAVSDRAVNGTASAPLPGRRRLYAARPYLNSAFTRPSEAGATPTVFGQWTWYT